MVPELTQEQFDTTIAWLLKIMKERFGEEKSWNYGTEILHELRN